MGMQTAACVLSELRMDLYGDLPPAQGEDPAASRDGSSRVTTVQAPTSTWSSATALAKPKQALLPAHLKRKLQGQSAAAKAPAQLSEQSVKQARLSAPTGVAVVFEQSIAAEDDNDIPALRPAVPSTDVTRAGGHTTLAGASSPPVPNASTASAASAAQEVLTPGGSAPLVALSSSSSSLSSSPHAPHAHAHPHPREAHRSGGVPYPTPQAQAGPSYAGATSFADWLVQDEYDPFRPNDYAAELAARRAEREARRAERAQQRAQKELEKQLQKRRLLEEAGAFGGGSRKLGPSSSPGSTLGGSASRQPLDQDMPTLGPTVSAPSMVGGGIGTGDSGRGRGIDNRPAWMKALDGGAEPGTVPGAAVGVSLSALPPSSVPSSISSVPVPVPAPAAHTASSHLPIGMRLLAKMGYDPSSGKGLGKDGTGITAPLEHVRTGRGSGIIRAPPPAPVPTAGRSQLGATASSASTSARAAPGPSSPSPVLLLRGLVDVTPVTGVTAVTGTGTGTGQAWADPLSDEALDALREDVLLHCEQRGFRLLQQQYDDDHDAAEGGGPKGGENRQRSHGIEDVFVYTLAPAGPEGGFKGMDPASIVRVFVRFSSTDACTRALNALRGSSLRGRLVKASFFPEERFKQLDLAPTDAEDT